MQPKDIERRGLHADSAYQTWQKGEGIPTYHGSYLADLYTAEVAPWARTGQKGAFVNLADQEHDDGWLIEIGPGGKTQVLHHLCESTVYVLQGRGTTSFWQKDGPKQTLEWGPGSVFSPPVNCHYQHFNLDGQQPVRLFTVTNLPMVMNMYRSDDFIFGDGYVFKDRYDSSNDYFSDPGHQLPSGLWQTNFIPDIRSFELEDHSWRGEGDRNMRFKLANNQMECHTSEFPPGLYKKAHRHGVGAHVVILTGVGYSLLWFEGEKPRQVDWKDGSVLSPKEMEYHQHFNTGPTPARYFAMRLGALDHTGAWYTPEELEGISYEDQDPEIHDLYVTECAKHGAQVKKTRPEYAGAR
ncbi:MAG: Gentisate 1,2-dioxygenase [Chloroflexi bacterium]|nr:Gentisate 1,2-dioxygenase [Chloroflexota bacterium]